MTLTPRQRQALSMFESFGWHKASPKQAKTLPVGTRQQQQFTMMGLNHGDFSAFDPKYQEMLTLFAVRLGVSPKRVVHMAKVEDPRLLADLLKDHGVEYATKFVEASCALGMRNTQTKFSKYGQTNVILVVEGTVPIPNDQTYFWDWSRVARKILSPDFAKGKRPPRSLPAKGKLQASVKEHLYKGVAAGTPGRSPIREVIDKALSQKFIKRKDAIELGFIGLEQTKMPRMRRAWVELLVQTCEITPKEIFKQYDRLLPIIRNGDSAVIEFLAAPLLPIVTDAQLGELGALAFGTKTKAVVRLILRELSERKKPSRKTRERLAAGLKEAEATQREDVSIMATRLIDQWNLRNFEPEPEPVMVSDYWPDTPPLWQLPRFDPGELSIDQLAQQLQIIANRNATAIDEHNERFLSLLVRLALSNPEETRQVIGQAEDFIAETALAPWAAGEPFSWDAPFYEEDLFAHRLDAVCANLSIIPCLLSEPSFADFSIEITDFVARLKEYAAARVAVLQADLLVALFRLKLDDDLTSAAAEISELDLWILGPEYEELSVTVGEVFTAYIADPIVDPGVTKQVVKNDADETVVWLPGVVSLPESLLQFPDLLPSNLRVEPVAQLFPQFGDSAAYSLRWTPEETDMNLGINALVFANKPKPLSPAAAINLIAIQRAADPDVSAATTAAIQLAWSRGLLVPQTADVEYLDWQEDLTHLGKLVETMMDFAETGMLPLMWGLWDQMLLKTQRSAKQVAGVLDLTRAMEKYASHVPPAAAQVPGLRRIAARASNTKTCRSARAAVTQLPKVDISVTSTLDDTENESDLDFDTIWPEGTGLLPAQYDGARVRCVRGLRGGSRRTIMTEMVIPAWMSVMQFPRIDVEAGCCSGILVRDDGNEQYSPFYARVYWDGRQLIGEPANRDQPASVSAAAPNRILSTAMVGVVLSEYSTAPSGAKVRRHLASLIKADKVGSEAIKIALRDLLPSDVFTPRRIAYLLSTNPNYLPYLWPILSESLIFATEAERLPRWINNILDITLYYHKEIKAAITKGRVPLDEWRGIELIANSGRQGGAVKTAQELVALLGFWDSP